MKFEISRASQGLTDNGLSCVEAIKVVKDTGELTHVVEISSLEELCLFIKKYDSIIMSTEITKDISEISILIYDDYVE